MIHSIDAADPMRIEEEEEEERSLKNETFSLFFGANKKISDGNKDL